MYTREESVHVFWHDYSLSVFATTMLCGMFEVKIAKQLGSQRAPELKRFPLTDLVAGHGGETKFSIEKFHETLDWMA